ncbi:MAG: glucose 1-dehydrogenase [Chloroflexia bacterium]|nr:glucose 1-dehydrogenase [Chloroflexia bacterium]
MGRSRSEGARVIVTGAGSGIGRATARRFAAEGAAVLVLADRRPEPVEVTRAEIERLGATVITMPGDVGEPAVRDAIVDAMLAAAGGVDVLVSNAAPFHPQQPFLEFSRDVWLEDIAVNLNASFYLGQRVARAMAVAGGGSILYTASINATGAGRGSTSYCTTKAGILTLVKVMAVELAPYNIRVNAVSPGPADTAWSVQLVGEEKMEEFRHRFPVVPMGRLASADDIANAFLFLASAEAAYVTGHNLVVDGGLTARVYNVADV